MRKKRIAIIGTDPAGVIVGALLLRNGFLVDMVDPRDDVGTLPLTDGVHIIGSLELRLPLFYYKIEQLMHRYDTVFVICENSHVRGSLKKIREYLMPRATVCVLGTEEKDFGTLKLPEEDKPVIGTVSICANWEDNGIVKCTSSARHMVYDSLFELGELDNSITPRLLATKKLLESIGVCSISQGLVESVRN